MRGMAAECPEQMSTKTFMSQMAAGCCRLEIAKLQRHPKSLDYIDCICETEGRTLGTTKSEDRYINATDGDYQLLHT